MPFEIHPSPMKDEQGKNLLYVRPESKRKIGIEAMDEHCATYHALKPGELTLAFRAFIGATSFYLSQGFRIETPIGIFSPKIRLKRPITDPDEVKTSDVEFAGINYESVITFEEAVEKQLLGFRKAGNADTQQLLAEQEKLEQCLRDCLKRQRGYTTARLFSIFSGLTYYSARKQLDSWCKGDRPKLLKTKMGQQYIYTEV